MTSVEKRIVRVAQWGGDIMFKNIALAAILAVAVTGSESTRNRGSLDSQPVKAGSLLTISPDPENYSVRRRLRRLSISHGF